MSRGNGASRRAAGLRLSRIRLENWRNFVRVEAGLERRVFLVGPNASGKSNLLDAFRFLHDLVSVGGGLQEAVRQRLGISRLRSLAAGRASDVAIEVQLRDRVDNTWEYELRLTQDREQRPLIGRERVVQNDKVHIDRPNDKDRADPERLTQTYLQQVNVNLEFRAIADFFGSLRYLHIVPQLVRDPDRSAGRRNDPYGGDFLEQMASTNDRTLRSRLRRIESALKIAVPQLSGLELKRDVRGTPHVRGRYVHWRPQGAWQTEEQFSDGTLRLLGLLWAVLDGDGPLMLEEPELSLHPEVVRFVPQMLARMQHESGRQIMLSTHSSDLLQDTGIGLDEVLLLTPGTEGTGLKPASAIRDAELLLKGGSSIADVVLPMSQRHTRIV